MPAILPFPYGNHKSELMEPFTRFTAVAAPLDLANVDTGRIIPARFLRKPRGAPGYASFLFHDVRFNADGAERPEFVLNQAPYRDAKILVVAENFGCGSSREMAVWVLDAYGIRSVRSEEHTSELQSLAYLVCRLLLEKKKKLKTRCNLLILTKFR